MPHDNDGGCAAVRASLTRGEPVIDREFDGLLPIHLRPASLVHWTPIDVAQAAARFLAGDAGNTHVLDVGAGVGKFCVAGALATGARFTGIERRPALVKVARDLARALDATTARFTVGDATEIDWREFGGIYLYNPFGEHFIEPAETIDGEEQRSYSLYVHFVRATIARLYLMPKGTRVATYHGLGGPMPPGYSLVGKHARDDGVLRLYVRDDPVEVFAGRPPRDMFDDEQFEEITSQSHRTNDNGLTREGG